MTRLRFKSSHSVHVSCKNVSLYIFFLYLYLFSHPDDMSLFTPFSSRLSISSMNLEIFLHRSIRRHTKKMHTKYISAKKYDNLIEESRSNILQGVSLCVFFLCAFYYRLTDEFYYCSNLFLLTFFFLFIMLFILPHSFI